MVLACMMHWYISMMFVVPVLAVVGWCWLNTRRATRSGGPGDSGAHQSHTSAGLSH
jgi:hypothetical protein